MKEQILAKLDKKIAEAEKKLSPIHPASYSGDYKYWSALLHAREIVTETKEEDTKHG